MDIASFIHAVNIPSILLQYWLARKVLKVFLVLLCVIEYLKQPVSCLTLHLLTLPVNFLFKSIA